MVRWLSGVGPQYTLLNRNVPIFLKDVPDKGADTGHISFFIEAYLSHYRIEGSRFQDLDHIFEIQGVGLFDCLGPSLNRTISIQGIALGFETLFFTNLSDNVLCLRI